MSKTPTTTTDESPRTPSKKSALQRAYEQDSPLAEKINELAAEHGVNPEFIDLPEIMTVRTDNEGRKYIEDLNSVVRYFIDSGRLEPTEDFSENVAVVNQNQHSATTLERMVER